MIKLVFVFQKARKLFKPKILLGYYRARYSFEGVLKKPKVF